MHSKTYTAVISNDSTTRVVDMLVSQEKDRQAQVSEAYPGFSLIALIPGKHAQWSHVYQRSDTNDAQRENHNTQIDIWDISAIDGNLPT